PRTHSANDVGDPCKALLFQNAGCRGRTITTGTNRSNAILPIEFWRLCGEMVERKMGGDFDMTGVPFAWSSHIDDLIDGVFFDSALQFIHRDLFGGCQRLTRLMPRKQTTIQIADHILMADTRQAHSGFEDAFFAFCHEQDGSAKWNEGAGPRSKLSTESDVERPGNVSGTVLIRRPRIQDQILLFGERFKFLRSEGA